MSLNWNADPHNRLCVRGRSLEYACFGPSPEVAPTLVLLHEGLGSVALWRSFPEQLVHATGCGVFAYSRAGYGRSDPTSLPRPLDYHYSEAQDVLPEVLDALAPTAAVLIGHSDGASIAALHVGYVHDPRVAGAVLMAPHFYVEDIALPSLRLARKAYEDGALGEILSKYHNHPDVAFYGWNDTWLNPDFAAWRIDDALDSVTVPLLALQGREDQYASLDQIDIVARRQPVRTTHVAIDNCKHAPHLEQIGPTIDAIAHFLRQLSLQVELRATA